MGTKQTPVLTRAEAEEILGNILDAGMVTEWNHAVRERCILALMHQPAPAAGAAAELERWVPQAANVHGFFGPGMLADAMKARVAQLRAGAEPMADSEESTALLATLREMPIAAVHHGGATVPWDAFVKHVEGVLSRRWLELIGVMHSVDKWLDAPEDLAANPTHRAARARQVALQWGEKAEAEAAALRKPLRAVFERLRANERIDLMDSHENRELFLQIKRLVWTAADEVPPPAAGGNRG